MIHDVLTPSPDEIAEVREIIAAYERGLEERAVRRHRGGEESQGGGGTGGELGGVEGLGLEGLAV